MPLFTPKFETLRDLYLDELRDLYNAENQLLDALPAMAEAADQPELKAAFHEHHAETKGHVARLEQIFKELDEDPKGETCEAMKGLVKEGESYIKAKGDQAVINAGLIGAAQRVEHYEMAGYGTARSLATQLGQTAAATMLQETLNEEKEADKKLNDIALSKVNVKAS